MAGRTKPSEKGAVLIIVLFIIAGLAVVSVDMSRNVLLDHAFSLTAEAGLGSRPLLKSGETIAANFIVREFQKEKKEPGDECMASFLGRFREWQAEYSSRLRRWELEIEIEDENSRFPLRGIFPAYGYQKSRAAFYRQMLERILAYLLVQHGYGEGEDAARVAARHYIEQLMAWGGQGLLSNEAVKWYLSREPACYPPLRAPESLGELALVYWPDVDEAMARNVLLGAPGLPGLAQNCSLWTSGPINLNTMRTVVGWGFCATMSKAESFMADFGRARANQGDWLKPSWHMDVFSAHSIDSPPARTVGSSSRWYRVRVTAKLGSAQNRSEAVGWINKTQMTWVSRALL